MVVGVYGLLYWHAAWKLETAWPIIAVGLLGKVLGPIGMVTSFSDDWPRRLGMICIYNDLIWWLPFGLFLVRGTSIGRRLAALAPWLCVAHACGRPRHAGDLVAAWDAIVSGCRDSPEVTSPDHVASWTIGWAMWMLPRRVSSASTPGGAGN